MGAKEGIKKSIEEMTEQELDREIEECVRLLTDEEKVKFVHLLLRLAKPLPAVVDTGTSC